MKRKIMERYCSIRNASMACQVRAAIRCKDELPYKDIVNIFKGNIPYDKTRHEIYFLGFFEECYPELIKRFMEK